MMKQPLSLQESIDSLWAMQEEIVKSLYETLIMMGISTTVAILIGGIFGIFLFLTSDKQFLQNKPLSTLLGAFTNFMRGLRSSVDKKAYLVSVPRA